MGGEVPVKVYSHDDLALKAGPWLSSKLTGSGMRSSFEVPLAEATAADQYRADYVALGWMQTSFCEKYEVYGQLIRIKDPNYPGSTCLMHGRYPGVPSLLFIFEAKATRADFLSTFNSSEHHSNRKIPVGSLHWCVANKDICKPDELPAFWGLLVPSGRGLREIKRPEYHETTTEIIYRVAYRILWKRGCSRQDQALWRLAPECYANEG